MSFPALRGIPSHVLYDQGVPDGKFLMSAGGSYVPSDLPAVSGDPFEWISLTDVVYGAAHDGVTIDTAAVQAWIAAANAVGKCVMYAGPHEYLIDDDLDEIDHNVLLVGCGPSDPMFTNLGVTTFTFTSGTGTMFTLGANAHGTRVTGMHFRNTSGTAPTSGAGLLVLGGNGNRYWDLTFEGFYINMDVQDGGEWKMEDCHFHSPVKYALKIRHIDLPDGGDMGIFNCYFLAGDYNCDALIRWESGGGMRLMGCKLNTRTLAHYAQCGLDAAIGGGIVTVDLNVIGCSIENIRGPGIRGTVAAFGEFSAATITGNQFGYYETTTYSAVDITGWKSVTVGPNTGLARFFGSSAAMVKLTSVTHGYVGMNTQEGFAGGEVQLVTCTDVKTLGANLIVQDEGSSVDTAVETLNYTGAGVTATQTSPGVVQVDIPGTTDETIRDVLAAALRGIGCTIIVDDPGDTITVKVDTVGVVPITTLDPSGNLTFLYTEDGSLITAEVTP